MGMFKYYQPNADLVRDWEEYYEIDSGKIVFDLISQEKLLLDSKYIEVMKAAEVGACTAWIELSLGFGYGRGGLPVNHKLSRYYFEKLIDGYTNDETYSKDTQLLFEAYRAYGHFEMDNGNNEVALDFFHKALVIMLTKTPKYKWDVNLFLFLYNASIHQFPEL